MPFYLSHLHTQHNKNTSTRPECTLLALLLHAAGNHCVSYKFKCNNGYQCIDDDNVCDGEEDCSDGSDENGCNTGKLASTTCGISCHSYT